MAVRFQYEWHDTPDRWYGNELWEFDENGLMRRREASINDVPITEADRRYFAPRPEVDAAKDTIFRCSNATAIPKPKEIPHDLSITTVERPDPTRLHPGGSAGN